MTDRANRSLRSDVRNPILKLPAAARLSELSPESRAVLSEIMREVTADARVRAQESWKKNKGPMAAYWKAVGAYSYHIYRALRT